MIAADPVRTVTESSLDDDRRGQKADTAYRTISEVGTELNLPQHVLRFWESKFKQISPLKRGGGRRYYRPQDIELIKRIHFLLYTQGYTIKGVQKLLSKDRLLQQSVPNLSDNATSVSVDSVMQRQPEPVKAPVVSNTPATPPSYTTATGQAELQLILKRLKTLRTQLSERC